jgi:S-adenosylmethionine hydrolase
MTCTVTLLTDFGTVDGFVGAMKGVILSLAPDARLVDLGHELPPHDVRAGAWALREAAPYFPPGTIHVAVVDPGVGSARRPLLLRAAGQLLVGPDNGLLSLAARRCGGACEGWVLDASELHRPQPSATFHGRDIFAAVAGHLARGLAPERAGTPAREWIELAAPRAVRRADGSWRGCVVHVDRFGNLITNLEAAELAAASPAGGWCVALAGAAAGRACRALGPLRTTFADVAPGEWLAYLGSSGLLEIAVREGSASASGAGLGAEVEVRPC